MVYISVIHGVILLGLLLGSIVDIKKREVPDTVNYVLIFLGFSFAFILSIFYSDLSFVVASFFGYILFSVIGYVLFYLGQWGGGDAKSLMGVGSLIGLPLFSVNFLDTFLFSFFITLLFAGALWGVFWIFFLILKNKSSFIKKYFVLSKNSFFLRNKYYFVFVFVFVIIGSFFTRFDPFVEWFIILFFALSYFLLFFSAVSKAIEETAMVKKIPVGDLVEGDWVVGKLKLKNGKTFESPKTGLEIKDIETIKKNFSHVLVREGVPFIPSFFIAYVFCMFVGPWTSFIF